MRKSIYLAVIFLLVGVASSVLAYQPKLVLDKINIEVKDPEISKFYYSELSGDPIVYQIEADQSFNLYINLLIPAVDGARKDFNIEIRKGGKLIEIFNTGGYTWNNFHESQSKTDYFQGPEFKQEAVAGSYEIEVFNSNYQGKYVLVIGEKDESSIGEYIRTTLLLPKIKSQFFNQSLILAYLNQIGLYLLVFILAILIIFLLLKKIVRKLKTIKKIT